MSSLLASKAINEKDRLKEIYEFTKNKTRMFTDENIGIDISLDDIIMLVILDATGNLDND